MKRNTVLHLLPAILCSMLIACAGEPSAPQLAAVPQFSQDDNNGVGPGQEHEPFPNLDGVAKYKWGAPAWSPRDNHTVIGPQGGFLAVGGFAIILPRGAVDHPTQFHIVLPVDPKEKSRAVAQFGPHMTFNTNITVVLPFINTDAVVKQIVWWDGGKWVAIPTYPCGFSLCGTTNHFSVYAVWKGVIALGG